MLIPAITWLLFTGIWDSTKGRRCCAWKPCRYLKSWLLHKPQQAAKEFKESFAVNAYNLLAVFQFTNEKEKADYIKNISGDALPTLTQIPGFIPNDLI